MWVFLRVTEVQNGKTFSREALKEIKYRKEEVTFNIPLK